MRGIDFGHVADRLLRPHVAVVHIDQRPAGEVAIHHHLEDVVVQVGAREVPVVLVRLIEEVQPVQSLHPAHLHLDVQLLGIARRHRARRRLGVHQLVHADGVAVRHHRPVVVVAVDARNHVRRELEDLEGDVRPFQRTRRKDPQQQNAQQYPGSQHCDSSFSHARLQPTHARLVPPSAVDSQGDLVQRRAVDGIAQSRIGWRRDIAVLVDAELVA